MKKINLIRLSCMFILFLSFILSCQQKNANTFNHKPEIDSVTVIYYILPVNSNLQLTYFDDYYRPIEIFLRGTGLKDSITINNQGYTFLENHHTVYEVWSLLLKAGDTLLLEDNAAPDKSYSTFKIRSLNSDQRTVDLNYHTGYNKWRERNKEHHASMNKKLSFWSEQKNLDSVLFYLDQFYSERIAFAKQYHLKNQMTEDSYFILKDDIFAATTKSKLRAINKYFSKKDPERLRHLQSLIEVYSDFLNKQPEKRLNFHVLSTATLLTKEAIDPDLKDQKSRITEYLAGIKGAYKGKAKNLLLLDFLLKNKSAENFNQYYNDFKPEFKDTSMINYLDKEIGVFQLIKNLPSNQSYALGNNGEIVSIDSLLTEHKGKKIILNFWASWCAPCMKELNELLPSIKGYDSNKYLFIFLSVDNSKGSWMVAQKSLGMENLLFSFILAGNVNSKILSKFSVKGFPTTLFFNFKGEMQIKEAKIITPQRLNQLLINLE